MAYYGLFADQEALSKRPNLESLEQFSEHLKKNAPVRRSDKSNTGQLDCSLCCERMDVSCVLVRKCRCDSRPCEGHACRCKDFTGCFSCLAKLLWEKTPQVMRSANHFRAKCPFCKAEFCNRDVVLIRPQQDSTTPTSS